MNRVMIVSPSSERRSHLQQLAGAVNEFHSISAASNLEEALLALSKMDQLSYLFIDNAFGQAEVADFLGRARHSRAARTANCVLLLKPEDQERSKVADGMLMGVHAFLCEPFSVQELADIARLSRQVSMKGSVARLKAATGLMLSELLGAPAMDEEEGKRNLWQQVQETYERYKKITGESLSVPVVQEIQKTPVGQRVGRYSGVSNRVRKLVGEKFFKRGAEAQSGESRKRKPGEK